jgi:sugar (pentulose or hexulose) kinase
MQSHLNKKGRGSNMDNNSKVIKCIQDGLAVLGIEFGSTRIKAVLIDERHNPIGSGSYEWKNKLVDGIWTYDEEEIWKGLQGCYKELSHDIQKKYGVPIRKLGGIGISAMMHGYLPFDENNKLLAAFRTWRNNITEEASRELTNLFQYNIPQRWSIAHLYQAILNNEAHVKDIKFFTTLAGFVHWKLTGNKALGIGDASGMFPIDTEKKVYHAGMLEQFDSLISDKGYGWKLKDILPGVLCAGENAGCLTAEGANILDPEGNLEAGTPMCPPEGDAGTGMVATNTVATRTGNVSAGTSVFAMIVLEKELSRLYEELDMVTTPSGNLVAMAHSNNCTTDLNDWIQLFKESMEAFGVTIDNDKLFGVLYNKALEGDKDCGGLLSYCYHSGEHLTGFTEGRPLFARNPESQLKLSNFMRVHLYTALSAMKIGLDLLMKKENVQIDQILGHGGLFKTKTVGQKILAAAAGVPVSVMETAGEGGAWGIALLAAYMLGNQEKKESLASYLNAEVFANSVFEEVKPDPEDVEGFEVFMDRYKKGLEIERAAVNSL